MTPVKQTIPTSVSLRLSAWVIDAVPLMEAGEDPPTNAEARRFYALLGEDIFHFTYRGVRRAVRYLGEERVERWMNRRVFNPDELIWAFSIPPEPPYDVGVLDRLMELIKAPAVELKRVYHFWKQGFRETKDGQAADWDSLEQLVDAWRLIPPAMRAGNREIYYDSPSVDYMLGRGGVRKWLDAGFSLTETATLLSMGFSYKAPRTAKKRFDAYLRRGYSREEALDSIGLVLQFKPPA